MRHRRLPEPFTFYVDECLGRHVIPNAVRGALLDGERVEMRAPGTPDEAWLTEAGDRWICLTRDRALMRRPNELGAICTAGAGVALLPQSSGPDQARAIVAALPVIRRVARTQDLAFIVRLEREGSIMVLWSGGEHREPQARPSEDRRALAGCT